MGKNAGESWWGIMVGKCGGEVCWGSMVEKNGGGNKNNYNFSLFFGAIIRNNRQIKSLDQNIFFYIFLLLLLKDGWHHL